MPKTLLTRRLLVRLLGGSALVVPFARVARAAQTARSGALSPRTTKSGAEACDALLRPLTPGARFGRWTLVDVLPPERGAVVVVARGDDGATFQLEILARDERGLAAKPPAQTSRFALFVRNGGDGATRTVEEEGLAAMTLAEFVRANEDRIDARAFLTHADRLSVHRDALLDANDASPTHADRQARKV